MIRNARAASVTGALAERRHTTHPLDHAEEQSRHACAVPQCAQSSSSSGRNSSKHTQQERRREPQGGLAAQLGECIFKKMVERLHVAARDLRRPAREDLPRDGLLCRAF